MRENEILNVDFIADGRRQAKDALRVLYTQMYSNESRLLVFLNFEILCVKFAWLGRFKRCKCE